jgi:hypothetical protein
LSIAAPIERGGIGRGSRPAKRRWRMLPTLNPG